PRRSLPPVPPVVPPAFPCVPPHPDPGDPHGRKDDDPVSNASWRLLQAVKADPTLRAGTGVVLAQRPEAARTPCAARTPRPARARVASGRRQPSPSGSFSQLALAGKAPWPFPCPPSGGAAEGGPRRPHTHPMQPLGADKRGSALVGLASARRCATRSRG